MEHDIISNGKCFSCGSIDEFSLENSSHLCRPCFDKTWTQRRADHIREDEKAIAALLKSNNDLQSALEVATKKLDDMTVANATLTTHLSSFFILVVFFCNALSRGGNDSFASNGDREYIKALVPLLV